MVWRKKIIPICIVLSIALPSIAMINTDNDFRIKIVNATSNGGNTLYVGGSGPGNYTTIQSAIDNANAGDTVFVYSGTYYENLILNKSIDLVGENKDQTIIEGQNALSSVVDINSDGVRLSKFNITAHGGVGGIKIDSCSYIIITSNTIINNHAGIALFYSDSNSITDNTIITNDYAGIFIGDSSGNSVRGNTIKSNTAGILVGSSSENTIKENIITSNSAWGIALTSSNSNIITDNTITHNDDGISIEDSSDSNIIMGNTITNNERGIFLGSSSKNNRIYHNNFLNNLVHATTSISYGIMNAWDNGYPSGGNYWDDYNGDDTNGDDIGDTSYIIPGGDNLDRYPLMVPHNLTLNHPPTCSLSVSPTSGTAPLTVTFILIATDPDDSINTWTLDINNDGTPEYSGSGIIPATQQHTYQTAGNYIATLRVTDNQGAIDNDSKIIMVTYNQLPIADFTYSINETRLTFIDTSIDSDGSITEWYWDFGDDTYSDLKNPVHIYANEGSYTVTLTVTDNNGDTDTYSKIITVTEKEDGIPGFEFVLLLIVIMSLIIIVRKKKIIDDSQTRGK